MNKQICKTSEGVKFWIEPGAISADIKSIDFVEVNGYPANRKMTFQEWLEGMEKGQYSGLIDVAYVYFTMKDGEERRSFGKAWTVWDEITGIHYPTKLGLGAYGDSTAWSRRKGIVSKAY